MKQNPIFSLLPSRTFNVLFIIYWLIGIAILFLTRQGDVLLFINSISTSAFDLPMKQIDFLGHGVFALLLAVIFLFNRISKGVYFLSSLVFVSILTNLSKWVLFMQHYRPYWYFYFDDFYRYISIAPINYFRAFPSGHAMTAFAIAAVLSTMMKNKYLEGLVFAFAIIVSFARIYLCQHFFIDIFWGAILGVLAAILGKLILNRLREIDKNGIMELSILEMLRTLRKKR